MNAAALAASSHFFPAASAKVRWPRRLLALVVVSLLIATGWSVVAKQHALLWQRVPADVANRWVVSKYGDHSVPRTRAPP